jgi:glycine cleavage system pyridoxal-binding protein P
MRLTAAPIRLPKSANASLLDEARAAANCMVLHPACHDDPVKFYKFYPDNLRRK